MRRSLIVIRDSFFRTTMHESRITEVDVIGKRALTFVVAVVLLAMGCSHTSQLTKRSTKNSHSLGRSARHFDIPIQVNDRVTAWIDFFQGPGHDRFERYLQRSGRYVDGMRKILKEEGCPQDLVYLALIESGFSNHAFSRAKASGPWQFIRSTGVHYGLGNNRWVDERRDPEKATRAAARYLKKLYGDFGNWYLAMAAYNAGEGRISQAIQRVGTKDFWEISAPGTRYLKPETKDYVPKFIAAALIAKQPAHFGFKDVSYHTPLAYDEVTVEGPLDLTVASQLAKVDVADMESLNPELSRLITPPHHYTLRLPPGTKRQFEVAYAELPPEKRVRLATRQTHRYRVKRNDSLKKIASRFSVTVASIKKQNHLKVNSVRAGQRLLITTASPVREQELLAYNKKSRRIRQNGVEWLIRKDQKGEKSSNLTPDDVSDESEATDATENLAPEPADLDPVPEVKGNEAAATPPKQIEESDLEEDRGPGTVDLGPTTKNEKHKAGRTYVVRNGDSLWKISKKTGVSIQNIKEWNRLKDGKPIQPGKTLVVAAPPKNR